MPNYWKIVNNVIEQSDIILEILDARLIDESRNREIEKKIKRAGKQLIYVMNKCDLVKKSMLEKRKKELQPSVFISSKEHLGTTMLRDSILALGAKAGKYRITVGVVGYSNTGKSSVINALAGKAKARASSQSGLTRGLQKIRADSKIVLLDTPGVIPFREKDIFKHAVISALDVSKLKDVDLIAMELIKRLNGAVERYYGVQKSDDPEECLEAIAVKNNKIKKGNVPAIEIMSRIIIKDWQLGKIRV